MFPSSVLFTPCPALLAAPKASSTHSALAQRERTQISQSLYRKLCPSFGLWMLLSLLPELRLCPLRERDRHAYAWKKWSKLFRVYARGRLELWLQEAQGITQSPSMTKILRLGLVPTTSAAKRPYNGCRLPNVHKDTKN